MPHGSDASRLARENRELRRQLAGQHPKRDLIHAWQPVQAVPNQRNTNVIETDDVLVVGDLHANHIHLPFMKRVVGLCVSWGITHAVLNGDTFDMSRWKSFPGSRHDPSFRDEIASVRATLDVFAGVFDETVLTLGNHEHRFLKKLLNDALFAEDWSRLFNDHPNVTVLDSSFVFIHGEKHRTVAGHPDQYSRIPGNVSRNIQREHFPDYHLIGAHTHHVSDSTVRNSCGKFRVIEPGCGADPETIGYAEQNFTSMPAMNTAAVIVKDGYHWKLEPETPLELMAAMYQGVA